MQDIWMYQIYRMNNGFTGCSNVLDKQDIIPGYLGITDLPDMMFGCTGNTKYLIDWKCLHWLRWCLKEEIQSKTSLWTFINIMSPWEYLWLVFVAWKSNSARMTVLLPVTRGQLEYWEGVTREQLDPQQSLERGDELKSKLQTLCIRHIWMEEAGNSTKHPDSSWMARLGKLNSKSYLVEDCTCNVPILVK